MLALSPHFRPSASRQLATIDKLGLVLTIRYLRIVPHLVRTTLLTPQMSLKLIDLVEKILFPDGYPAPSPDDPTPSEVEDLRRRFENRLIEVIPRMSTSYVPIINPLFRHPQLSWCGAGLDSIDITQSMGFMKQTLLMQSRMLTGQLLTLRLQRE